MRTTSTTVPPCQQKVNSCFSLRERSHSLYVNVSYWSESTDAQFAAMLASRHLRRLGGPFSFHLLSASNALADRFSETSTAYIKKTLMHLHSVIIRGTQPAAAGGGWPPAPGRSSSNAETPRRRSFALGVRLCVPSTMPLANQEARTSPINVMARASRSSGRSSAVG